MGYSGGPDSKALLYALLEEGVIPHLAHVDHGWREESQREAEELSQEASRLGCPFHATRLELKGRSEEEARRARFAFFQSLSFPTVLLAHHADDVAETVLKRIFEGAHLPFLGGMQPISQMYGMTVWRPLLKAKRSEILSFLEERSLKAIEDPTNRDPLYLRSRLRFEMLPYLAKIFGKEIFENLTLLSERSFELRAHLDLRVEQAFRSRGPWGLLADLQGLAKIEQRHLLQVLAREEGIGLSRAVLETLLRWIEEDASSKCLEVEGKKIWVDRGRVWFFS